MSWDHSAACRGYPVELFEAVHGRRGDYPRPGVATICGDCPVTIPCLADGFWDEFTIRGTLTPMQRVALGRYITSRRLEMTG